MSRYSDINQLLDEIGTSDRSAGDPWTISRSNQGSVKRDSFSPAVVADLGAPAQGLTSEMQSSEQIAKADQIATSPTGSSAGGSSKSSLSSGFMGGLLSLFPLASVVGKLFGLGGSASPPPLTPYIQPPSVSFEGAVSGSLSDSTTGSLMGVGSTSKSSNSLSSGPESQWAGASGSSLESLSYNAEGLPRTTEAMPSIATAVAEAPKITGQYNSSPDIIGQLTALTSSTPVSESPVNGPTTGAIGQPEANTTQDVIGQLTSLTTSNFTSEPAAGSPIPGPDLIGATSARNQGSSVSALSDNDASPSTPGAATNAPNSPQGQSILVQVQTMDSQSFMDHSNDIAQAVRQAMLNLHSVNDVIADL